MEEHLQQAEYIGTHLEREDIEVLVEEQGSREANLLEEELQIQPEITAKKETIRKKKGNLVV